MIGIRYITRTKVLSNSLGNFINQCVPTQWRFHYQIAQLNQEIHFQPAWIDLDSAWGSIMMASTSLIQQSWAMHFMVADCTCQHANTVGGIDNIAGVVVFSIDDEGACWNARHVDPPVIAFFPSSYSTPHRYRRTDDLDGNRRRRKRRIWWWQQGRGSDGLLLRNI